MSVACLNLVLIGMPGCGKSSVGRCVSRQLGMPLLDTDAMVEAREGCTVSDVFATRGEAVFRDAESACASEAAAHHGVVIATGGGMILRPGNMETLSRNGLVIFLDRHPEDILRDTCLDDRPLVAADSTERIWNLYHERLPLYRRYAGHCVPNAGPLRQVVRTVARLYTQRTAVCDSLSSTDRTSTCWGGENRASTETEPTSTCASG